jgi:hypothetical protein
MIDRTDSESVLKSVARKPGASSQKSASAVLGDRESAHAMARLRKRVESRVEKELDEFWDNVPI